jgi:4-hydroxy-tetrahydrodipicolinate synthase
MELIEKLLNKYGPVIAGAKDSGGQWSNTASMIERFSARGFSVFAGSENFLMRTMRAGGAGCISATANVNPAAISSLCANWTDSDADAQQQRLDLVRSLFSALPMIPAMKTAVAQTTGKEDWKVVRPPLISLTAAQETQLLNSMTDAGFSMKIDYT